MQPPEYPMGKYVSKTPYTANQKKELITAIEKAPAILRQTVEDLSEEQQNTIYKNWTIRQIVHHLADSHLNALLRFKWTLTEETPTIKPYHEGLWVQLADSQKGPIGPALLLLEGLHQRWGLLLRSLTPDQFERRFFHPEMQEYLSLDEILGVYAWHCQHHIGQISWMRTHRL